MTMKWAFAGMSLTLVIGVMVGMCGYRVFYSHVSDGIFADENNGRSENIVLDKSSIYFKSKNKIQNSDDNKKISTGNSQVGILRQKTDFEISNGRWYPVRDFNNDNKYTDAQLKEMQRLRSIGYLTGSQKSPRHKGITVYDRQNTRFGYNLVVSGHFPGAMLLDMNGETLHQWECAAERAWPNFNISEYYDTKESQIHTYWRRAHLIRNGDILAIFEGIGIIRLNKDSDILWSVLNGAHHDLYVAKNGNIYVLTRKSHINPEINTDAPILEDFITILTGDGEFVREISILKALKNSNYAPILSRLNRKGDILHTNTIEFIERDHWNRAVPWRKGDVLISIRYLDLICTIDIQKNSVRWAESDFWFRQHQPEITSTGNLMVFNNKNTIDTSSVVELDPISRQIVWSYKGNDSNPFFTETCGSNQRLENGNTLIIESDQGRAFEVTPAKKIVWEYINPYRAGEDNELIATLFDVVRFDPAFTDSWLTIQ